ncbi:MULTISPECIES: hypothetical protein [unclassified Lactobacillus]|uniref:hypothetical protein n=1 Tax=unclassified Lactobacillus TaxID=2620435 RepID=UPI000BEF01B3|nr:MULTISPECIES: hypothetical protein [unclassified Lactobacillus]PEG86834.1 hypothetical protein CP365_05835 [Lactobacillus sp. UMNPBX14]PEH02383.1 hypothetical protein CP357_05835 [Lactobacillus sp. UMNPBX6]
MNNQETNQTETVTDTKPADNTQDATASTPLAPTVSESVKLDLSADQAEMVQDLLNNYVYAYRSDREVDCKRELVRRDQVGKYPYIAEEPDPSIINPIYDWVGKKWYSKNGATSLPEIAQAVKDLQSDQQAGTTQNLALTKAVKELSEGQANQNKLLTSMQNLMLQLASGKATASAVPTQPTTDDKTTDNTNGGNN